MLSNITDIGREKEIIRDYCAEGKIDKMGILDKPWTFCHTCPHMSTFHTGFSPSSRLYQICCTWTLSIQDRFFQLWASLTAAYRVHFLGTEIKKMSEQTLFRIGLQAYSINSSHQRSNLGNLQDKMENYSLTSCSHQQRNGIGSCCWIF